MSILKVNDKRLLDRMEIMARIGAVQKTGVHRLSLTDEDKEARDLLSKWMEEAGLRMEVDKIGNMYGYRDGEEKEGAPIAFGSHLDTVGYGGRFDGSLGVMAALETIETLNEKGIKTQKPLCLVNFTNEEGARFAPDMMGSIIVKGERPVEAAWSARDIKHPDIVLKDELERIGYLGPLDPTAFRPEAFLELHIEQGPILEKEDLTIGVVEQVQGILWLEFEISGQSNHAGTTPMDLRQDAGLVAAKIVNCCRELALKYPTLRATAGLIDFHPNLINVVAGKARITADLRSPDKQILIQAENELLEVANHIANEEGTSLLTETLTRVEPVDFEKRVVEAIENSANSLRYSNKRMLSGAGHDAQLMAGVCSAAMIFIPSKNGISHSIDEYSSPEHVVAGANVLLNAVVGLSGIV